MPDSGPPPETRHKIQRLEHQEDLGACPRCRVGAISHGSRARPGPKRSETALRVTAGRGGRLRRARRCAPARIHRRGWSTRHASRFSEAAARPRTPVPERGRRTTTRVQPGSDHQASAAVIALSASWMPSPTSPAVAAQCNGTRARAPGSQRCSSRVSGSGAIPS